MDELHAELYDLQGGKVVRRRGFSDPAEAGEAARLPEQTMSASNVELVQRIYDHRLLDGDPGPLLDLMAPDVEYVNPQDAVEPGTRRGREEVARALTALGDFDWTSNDLHELFDAGDSVVAQVTFRVRSRGSEHQVAQEEAHTWTLREGRIVRFEWGRDLPAALNAVGQPE